MIFCCVSVIRQKRGNLRDQANKDDAYITRVVSSWKKASKCFYSHQSSSCYRAASSYHIVVPQCNNIGELMDNQLVQGRQAERKYFLEVIKCLRCLARQGIPLQGHDGNGNFAQLLYLLGTKDDNIMNYLERKLGHKYNHQGQQNELLNIMGAQVLWEKLAVIRDRKFFSIMADEGTDISYEEQLSFCVRTLGDNSNGDEETSRVKSEKSEKSIKNETVFN